MLRQLGRCNGRRRLTRSALRSSIEVEGRETGESLSSGRRWGERDSLHQKAQRKVQATVGWAVETRWPGDYVLLLYDDIAQIGLLLKRYLPWAEMQQNSWSARVADSSYQRTPSNGRRPHDNTEN